jgi:isopentenyl phosphate kinase
MEHPIHCTSIIKIGGSLICSKNNTFNIQAISNIVADIKEINDNIILLHGGGHFTKSIFLKSSTNSDFIDENNKDIVELFENRIQLVNTFFQNTLEKCEIKCKSIRPSSIFESDNGIITIANINIINELLTKNKVPILYGDIIYDKSKSYYACSSDQLVSCLARIYNPTHTIFLTNTNGVFKSYPTHKNKHIQMLTRKLASKLVKPKYQAGVSEMSSKISRAFEALEYSENCFIIDGRVKNNLYNALNDNIFVGTRILE